MDKNVAILGGGNLGSAIAKGFINSGTFEDNTLTVTRRNAKMIEYLEELGIKVTSDNIEAVQQSELIILAVQPQQIENLLSSIKDTLDPDKHTIISVVTGITVNEMHQMVGEEHKIIRAMPNTAVELNKAMTCISDVTSNGAKEAATELFDLLGRTIVIDENLMEAATVLSGCGIAYFLRLIRAVSQGGIETGFHAEEAQYIAAQTALGAASMLLESDVHPEQAIDKVTTPRGCTIAGLNEMEHYGLSSALIKGIKTSFDMIDTIS